MIRLAAAAVLLSTTLPAHAALTVSSARSAYYLSTNIYDLAGNEHRLPRDEELISLLETPSITRTRDLASTVANGSLVSTLSGADQFTFDETSFSVAFTGEAHSQATWSLESESELDLSGASEHRTHTRFTTDRALSVSLAGAGAISNSTTLTRGGGSGGNGETGPEPPFRLWVRLYEDGEVESPAYEMRSEAGNFDALFTIDPGQYIFQISVLSWLELDTLTSGDGSAFDSASLTLNASFTTIPAPGATLLLPLAAFTARRRR